MQKLGPTNRDVTLKTADLIAAWAKSGISLTRIAAEFGLPYERVQQICEDSHVGFKL